MAIVEGPMCSLSAKNQFAKVFVNFVWKGLNIIRFRVDPVQPRTPAVMNMRIKYKALGKVSKVFSLLSTLKAALKEVTPPGVVWNGFWVGVAIKQFMKDNDAFDAFALDYTSATAVADFLTDAGTLGLVGQTLEVEGKAADHPVEFNPGQALYALAKACWYAEVKDEALDPYTDPKAWETAAVNAFTARITD